MSEANRISKKDKLDKFKKIEFSIRMLHFHHYINDNQFMKMIDKMSKEIEESGVLDVK